MRAVVTLLAVYLIGAQLLPLTQAHVKSKPPRVRTVSLRQVGKYAETYTADTVKLAGVVLEDFRAVERDWVHVFQLYDPKTKLRRGEVADDGPYDTHAFLICADDEIGKPLLAQKDKWLNRPVNLYLKIGDRALTTHVYVGFAMKIELLDEKGRVTDTLTSQG